MAWNTKVSIGDVIGSGNHNEMIDCVTNISSNRISSNASIDKLGDVDTTADSPSRDEVLKWNGTNWVPASYDTTFEFSIASFSDGESTTQLIGTGVWKASGTVDFTATYNNGPPDNAVVQLSINGAGYNTVSDMYDPNYASGTNIPINYPAAKDQYLRFRISANASTDTDIEYETSIYFRNYVYWGILDHNSSFTEADVEGLAGSQISNDHTLSNKSVNVTAGNYLVVAHPASYTDLPTGDDYEDDGGGTGFRFDGKTCAFDTKETVSITNSAGYTENYDVYGSKIANLGNHTLYTYTSRQELNTIYYGVTSKTDTYTEADVEGLAESSTTNTYDGTVWNTLSPGAGEYLLFAFPKRWGEKGTSYSFYDNGTGFEASFQDAETVSITNSCGWTEDFYVYRSVQPNLGSIDIRSD